MNIGVYSFFRLLTQLITGTSIYLSPSSLYIKLRVDGKFSLLSNLILQTLPQPNNIIWDFPNNPKVGLHTCWSASLEYQILLSSVFNVSFKVRAASRTFAKPKMMSLNWRALNWRVPTLLPVSVTSIGPKAMGFDSPQPLVIILH